MKNLYIKKISKSVKLISTYIQKLNKYIFKNKYFNNNLILYQIYFETKWKNLFKIKLVFSK